VVQHHVSLCVLLKHVFLIYIDVYHKINMAFLVYNLIHKYFDKIALNCKCSPFDAIQEDKSFFI